MQQTKDKLLIVAKYLAMKTKKIITKAERAIRDQYIDVVISCLLCRCSHWGLDRFHARDLHPAIEVNTNDRSISHHGHSQNLVLNLRVVSDTKVHHRCGADHASDCEAPRRQENVHVSKITNPAVCSQNGGIVNLRDIGTIGSPDRRCTH